MEKITCKHDQCADVRITEEEKVLCCNLIAEPGYVRQSWKCSIIGRECSYNGYNERRRVDNNDDEDDSWRDYDGWSCGV